MAQVVLEVPEVDRAPRWMPAVCGALRGKVVVAAESQEQGAAVVSEGPEVVVAPAVPDSTGPVVHQEVPVQKEEEGRRLGSGSRRQLCSGRAQLQVAVAG